LTWIATVNARATAWTVQGGTAQGLERTTFVLSSMKERSSHWLRCKAVLINRWTGAFLKVSGWAGLDSPPQRLRCILLLPTLLCGVRRPSWLSAIGTMPLGGHFLNAIVIVSIVSILVAIICARGFLFRR
jgi:hypothetical protein